MLSQYSAGTFLSPTAKSGHDLSNEENTYTKNGAIGSVERIFELPKGNYRNTFICFVYVALIFHIYLIVCVR